MFGTSGIRGPVGEDVTAQLGTNLGTALAAWGANRVVVGRDARQSGAYLKEAVRSGLRQGGVDVVDVGVAATPTIARTVGWREADAGVAVTASHNPPADNGFKLWLPSGQAFRPREQTEIEGLLDESIDEMAVRWDEVGALDRWDRANERHVEALITATSLPEPLHVVVDIGNGTGQMTARALDALGCKVATINGQPDGGFPGRPSEPNAENCADLRSIVPAVGADLGIAHDGDADRMRAADHTGRFLSGDALLAIFGAATATAGDRVVAPVDTSLAVEDALAAHDIDLVRTRVGDVFVAEGIQETNAVFGGEPSGAWIWPDQTFCPDGPLAACRLVELVADQEPLAAQVDRIDTYPIRRDALEVQDKPGVMEFVTQQIHATYDSVETIDGVRVSTDDGWFLIRPSGTEPVVRVTAEARDPARASALLEDASTVVRNGRESP